MNHHPDQASASPALQTIVISLLKATQRREKVQQELSKTSLKWSFLDAVDGAKMQTFPPEYEKRKVLRLLGFSLTPNEIGCFLSHKQAWQNCVKHNQTTLIFEDDFILSPSFEEVLETLLTRFNDWNLIRLQALVDSKHEVIQVVDGISIIRNYSDPLGATAYIVKPEAARILIENAKYIYEPLDHFLEHHKKHGIEMLAVKPYPVDITKAPSTISDRPDDRKPIKGLKKKARSLHRFLDRVFSRDPWFPG